MAAGYLSLLLMLYPIAWGCSEGSNIISVTSEMIWYGILDVLAGPGFLFFYLWQLRTVDYAAFGLHSGKYTDHSAHSAVRAEKGLPVQDAPAAAPAPATVTQ